jgi:hypothetical protein
MQKLECTGRDLITRTFGYKSRKDQFEEIWHFEVHTDPPQVSGEFFELSVTDIGSGKFQITMISHHEIPAYKAMGIPDALLPVVSQQLVKKLCSSPSEVKPGNYRTDAATKMWERLRLNGMATYDSITDIYTLQ